MKSAELYACLYVKDFPAQALLRLRPELQGKPCVVMEGEPPMQCVCSFNNNAHLLGIAHGMTRVEIDTFPATTVLPRSRNIESATKAILLESAGAFSPRLEERSEDTSFLCGIDIAGTSGLFGAPEMLAQNLLQNVRAVGITACITVSRNFHVAVCLARGQSPDIPVQAIAPGEEATALAPLPLTVLDLTETQAEIFSLWGIHNLGILAALPEKNLIARMGQCGQRLRQLARGELPHLFQPIEPPFNLEERIDLDSPVEQLESLLFGVGVMLDQLILRAKARIVALASVTVTLTLDGGSTHTRTIRPALPSNEKHLWIKLLHVDLEAHPPHAAVHAVTLNAEPGSTSKVQLGLFSPQLPEASRLDVTLARIRALVGEGNVGRAVLQDAHAPESFCVDPFCIPSGNAVVSAAPRSPTAMRPLRPPETVSVHLQNQQPAALFFREREYAVEHAYGPWAADGEWWNQTLWGMEQWDVIARARDGSMLCCCMMRDRMQNQWQMAAFYD